MKKLTREERIIIKRLKYYKKKRLLGQCLANAVELVNDYESWVEQRNDEDYISKFFIVETNIDKWANEFLISLKILDLIRKGAFKI